MNAESFGKILLIIILLACFYFLQMYFNMHTDVCSQNVSKTISKNPIFKFFLGVPLRHHQGVQGTQVCLPSNIPFVFISLIFNFLSEPLRFSFQKSRRGMLPQTYQLAMHWHMITSLPPTFGKSQICPPSPISCMQPCYCYSHKDWLFQIRKVVHHTTTIGYYPCSHRLDTSMPGARIVRICTFPIP